MSTAQEAVAGALDELEKARRVLMRVKGNQVRNIEHRQFLQAIAYSWFRTRKPSIAPEGDATKLDSIGTAYTVILNAAERSAAKSTYTDAIKAAKQRLIDLRADLVAGRVPPRSSDVAPDFSALASDAQMRAILTRRWDECTRCIDGQAFLAATVMMGGLLEALLVARANRLTDKSGLFAAKSAPVDSRTKKPLELRAWMLGSYIDVAHDVGWLTKSAKDVAVVLRDYRNYIHPEKERAHGITLGASDARMFWELVKLLARQVLASAAAAAPGA